MTDKEIKKTYSYNNSHNPDIPADYWFQNSTDGPILFIVFYTQACRWSKCMSCNLPSLMSENHVSYKSIIKQVDHIFDNIIHEQAGKDPGKIIISNNGSILDEETFSTTALLYFIAKMNIHCPEIKTLSIETRPEYVDFAELEVMARALREGESPTVLEVAIGFEAFDDRIRNEYFKKGLDLEVFEKLTSLIAKHKFKLKTYFMLKPVPGLSEEEAKNDIRKGIDYLDDISIKYNVDINMHLNPTYVAKGTPLEVSFKEGLYIPPSLQSVKEVAGYSEGKNISIFLGLYDEGLSVEGGSFIKEGENKLLEQLEEFNRTQDYSILRDQNKTD